MAKDPWIQVNPKALRVFRRTIKAFDHKAQIRIARKSNRAALKPMLEAAYRFAPVDKGRLRDSLGIKHARVRNGRVTSVLKPRAKYRMKGLTEEELAERSELEDFNPDDFVPEEEPISIRERRAGHPRTYAFYIEKGRTSAGGRIRRAGPARFLEKAYQRGRMQALDLYSKRFWKAVDFEFKKTQKAQGAPTKKG